MGSQSQSSTSCRSSPLLIEMEFKTFMLLSVVSLFSVTNGDDVTKKDGRIQYIMGQVDILKTRIFFSAYMDKGIFNVRVGETVKFEKVYINDGNGYDTTTGVFKCTVPGVYEFTVAAMAHSTKRFNLGIYVNDM